MTAVIKSVKWTELFWQRPFALLQVHDVLSHIASLSSRSFIIWEVRATAGKVRYLIGASPVSMTRIKEVFKSHGGDNIQFADVSPASRKPVSDARQLKASHPLMSLNTETVESLTRATLAAMTSGKKDEECCIQLVIGRAYRPSGIPKDVPNPSASFLDVVLGKVKDASPEQYRSMKEKAEQFGFEVSIRVGGSGEHTSTRINNIVSALRTIERAGAYLRVSGEEPSNLNIAAIPWKLPMRLSVKELASFMLLPAGDEEILPGTPGLHPKQLLSPKWYQEPKPDTAIDRTFAASLDNPPKRLSISPRDALEHSLLIGPTGSGKSTAMLNLILSDIKAGRSVLVLDPKEDLVTGILERIPEERAGDVVVICPTDASPVGFNPLAFRSDPALTSDTILSVFQELFASNWGIRTADVLNSALNTLARTPKATLLWLEPLLTDDAFRKKITSKLKDPFLKKYWIHYEDMRPSERRTEIAPVLNKLRQISLRPGLRNVLGQAEPKFSLTDLFLKRRIVLVPLNKGQIGGESARLLGSLIVGLTWSLALSRAAIPPEKRHMVSIYIDELQDYLALPTSFSDALAQARGLGMAYTVAHQYRGQLPPDIKSAIDANARNKIAFGLNADDAKDMAEMAPELSPVDFMTLPRFSVYCTFMNNGKSTGWISGKTFPPPEPIRMAAELHAKSMQLYGRDADETEKEILSAVSLEEAPPDPAVSDAPIGRKKRTK